MEIVISYGVFVFQMDAHHLHYNNTTQSLVMLKADITK